MKTRKAKSVLDAYLIAKKEELTMKTKKYPCDVCKEVAILEDGQCPKCIQALIDESTPQHTPSSRMKSVPHTPTPWKIGTWKTEKENQTVIKSGAVVIATMQWQLDDKEDNNAAFIVRAVNAHEELLEAIKGLLEYGIPSVDDGWKYQRISAVDKLRRVISQAKGK